MPKKTKAEDQPKPGWQNRIVGYAQKPAKDFNFNPLNWRTHGEAQRSALTSVLSEVGWVTGVVENVTTGNLIDGHARIEEALKKDPETLVPYLQVNLTPDEERKILAILDPIGALAGTDSEKLHDLFSMLDFQSENLSELLSGIVNLNSEQLSDEIPNLAAPDFNYQNRFGVIVECENEQHQEKVFKDLTSQGYSVKVVVV